jgi:hypothetical protein
VTDIDRDSEAGELSHEVHADRGESSSRRRGPQRDAAAREIEGHRRQHAPGNSYGPQHAAHRG